MLLRRSPEGKQTLARSRQSYAPELSVRTNGIVTAFKIENHRGRNNRDLAPAYLSGTRVPQFSSDSRCCLQAIC
jgi:hypothetical protein